MESNAPLERLINTVMDLDGLSENPDYAVEMRCLMRKIEWVAAEAELARKRCATKQVFQKATTGGLQVAA